MCAEVSDMEKRFSRNIPSIGTDEQKLLEGKHVLVAGCGGIGGYIIEYLARAGIGRITVVDKDSFDETNLNRQLYATVSSIGRSKVLEAKAHAEQINPDLKFEFWMSRLRPSTVKTALMGKDIVIDALDSVEDRLMLEKECEKQGLYLIHGAVAGWRFQVMSVSPGSGSLRMFYDNNAVSSTRSVLSFVPAACAAVQTAEALKILLGRKPALEDHMLLEDLKEMTREIISPDEHFFAERQIDVTISKYNQKEIYTVPEKTTLREIIEILSLEGETLYIMRNGEYVMPEDFDLPVIEEGDFLEFRKSAAFGG